MEILSVKSASTPKRHIRISCHSVSSHYHDILNNVNSQSKDFFPLVEVNSSLSEPSLLNSCILHPGRLLPPSSKKFTRNFCVVPRGKATCRSRYLLWVKFISVQHSTNQWAKYVTFKPYFQAEGVICSLLPETESNFCFLGQENKWKSRTNMQTYNIWNPTLPKFAINECFSLVLNCCRAVRTAKTTSGQAKPGQANPFFFLTSLLSKHLHNVVWYQPTSVFSLSYMIQHISTGIVDAYERFLIVQLSPQLCHQAVGRIYSVTWKAW